MNRALRDTWTFTIALAMVFAATRVGGSPPPTSDPTDWPTLEPTMHPTKSPIQSSCRYLTDQTKLDVMFLVDKSCEKSSDDDGTYCRERQKMIAELMTSIKGADNRAGDDILSRVGYMEFGSSYSQATIRKGLTYAKYNLGPTTLANITDYHRFIQDDVGCGYSDSPGQTDLYDALKKAQSHLHFHLRPNSVEKIIVISECQDSGHNGNICNLWDEIFKCAHCDTQNDDSSVTDLIFINLKPSSMGYGECLAFDDVFDYDTIDMQQIVSDVNDDICRSPTPNPTTDPTINPTLEPTRTRHPTSDPTDWPTWVPTSYPTTDPITDPTTDPTTDPITDPTTYPTSYPTIAPTLHPTTDPTDWPTWVPTSYPTIDPTLQTTRSRHPTTDPTDWPTWDPTSYPTTLGPTSPTSEPIAPTSAPTLAPISAPTSAPIDLSLFAVNSEMKLQARGCLDKCINDRDGYVKTSLVDCGTATGVKWKIVTSNNDGVIQLENVRSGLKMKKKGDYLRTLSGSRLDQFDFEVSHERTGGVDYIQLKHVNSGKCVAWDSCTDTVVQLEPCPATPAYNIQVRDHVAATAGINILPDVKPTPDIKTISHLSLTAATIAFVAVLVLCSVCWTTCILKSTEPKSMDYDDDDEMEELMAKF